MTKREWLKLFSFFYAIIQKNINFLRRPSKKADFIIENIFEEVNIIDDKKIIELYFERNQQAVGNRDRVRNLPSADGDLYVQQLHPPHSEGTG